MNIKKLLTTCSILLLLVLLASSCENRQKSASDKQFSVDVIVYGGNSSAVVAAVQVAKMGKEVILVSPDKHLGGLTSSGLGWTDTGNKAVIGGLARDFYHRLYLHYQDEDAWRWQEKSAYGNQGQGNVAIDGENRTMWIFEPHAAELVFEELVSEYKIPVHREAYLDREHGLVMKEGAIQSIQTLDGTIYLANQFIDATYEGDLMAASGVTYTVGREAISQYNEAWNGVQTGVLHHGHHFKSDISPYVIPGNTVGYCLAYQQKTQGIMVLLTIGCKPTVSVCVLRIFRKTDWLSLGRIIMILPNMNCSEECLHQVGESCSINLTPYPIIKPM